MSAADKRDADPHVKVMVAHWIATRSKGTINRPRRCVADTDQGDRCYHPTRKGFRLCGLHQRKYGIDA